ncbi:hypothetical protein [Pseudorhodoferax soli]|uniref:PcRGLX/YetA-like N-terminal RIFT barrel domain-containing protein n=1 Tax=Pseudorhodoferax soli TaxID=545864 RepID=A0A368Y8E8_9BURK|nr:hypothetical protein [Pseudorhodoferax soli]RCW76541.1 hypothetical protein DES41_1011149 [Pseudorhodoferax soli]
MVIDSLVLALVCCAAVGIGLLLAIARSRRPPPSRPAGGRRGLMLWLLVPGWLGRAVAASDSTKAATPIGKRLCVVRVHNKHTDRRQGAHFVTPMFGQAFRQGDMPAGERPHFTLADGTECPATLWGITSWPDGSMKFCAVMVRIPHSIPAGSVLEIDVRAGGSVAKPSPRTLEDFAPADLSVVLDGITALDGTWRASLNDGARARRDVVPIANGPAGAIWRVGSEFRNQAGSPHGQLYCWHYVAALNGAENELLGLRYLGRVAQPWTDVAQPKAQHREFSAELRTGTRVLRRLRGHVAVEMPGDAIRLPHYASFFTAGPDARWDTLHANGNPETEQRLRTSLDAAYYIASGLVPPYDLSAEIAEGEVTDYVPMGRGTVTRAMGTTGERADIGLLPEWNVRHLITQSDAHERIARVNGLTVAGLRLTFRKRETLQPVPCVDIRTRYEGLGRIEPSWRGYIYMSGMTVPSPNESLWREDTAHRPGCTYWPYLFTGEPQYLDLLTEHAFAHILELNQGNETVWGTTFPRPEVLEGKWGGERGIRVGVNGTLHKGSGVLLYGIGGTRMAAWRSRDVAQAAALAPDSPPDGAAVRLYLRDVMDSSYAAFRDYMSKVPASYRDSGLFIQGKGNGAPWQIAYMSWSVCHQADILPTANSKHVREHLSRFWSSFSKIADMACLAAYVCTYKDADDMLIQSSSQLLGSLRCQLTFDAKTSRVSISEGKQKTNGDWRAQNGDVFGFTEKRSPEIAPLLNGRSEGRFYAVNCQQQTFQLATTPSGKPLAFPKDLTVTDFFARLRSFAPNLAFDAPNSPSGYSANLRGAVAYHKACGDDVEIAYQSLHKIVREQHVKFFNRPKYLTKDSRIS